MGRLKARFGRRGRIVLPWLAGGMAIWAMVVSALHLVPPYLVINEGGAPGGGTGHTVGLVGGGTPGQGTGPTGWRAERGGFLVTGALPRRRYGLNGLFSRARGISLPA